MLDLTNSEIAFEGLSPRELKNKYRLFSLMNRPGLVKIGSKLALFGNNYWLPFFKYGIEKTLFHHFLGGKSLVETQDVIDKLWSHNTLTVLDYGAEAKTTEEELDHTMKETLKAIEFAGSNASVPVVSTKISGLSSNELLEKKQSGIVFSQQEEQLFEKVMSRVDSLCKRASELGVKVFIDAEESWMQETIDELVMQMMKKYNHELPIVYNTFQMYRKDRLEFLKASYSESQSSNFVLGAKLVRGAYMEKERNYAQEHGLPSPICNSKQDTDRSFDEGVKFCIAHYENLASCNATHNINSTKLQAQIIEDRKLPKNHPHLNFCQLYGMSDYITFNLAKAGYNVAKYVPYGPLKEVVPYLIRRAQENTSVVGEMSRELSFLKKELSRRKQ